MHIGLPAWDCRCTVVEKHIEEQLQPYCQTTHGLRPTVRTWMSAAMSRAIWKLIRASRPSIPGILGKALRA